MSTDKKEMTDHDLIGYAELHCLTPRALFSAEHINRMIALAGNPPGYQNVTGWASGHEEMAELCRLARARLEPQATALSNAASTVRMTLIRTGGAPEVAYPTRQQADRFASCSGPEVELQLVDGFFVAAPKAQRAAAPPNRQATPAKCDFCRAAKGTLHTEGCIFIGLVAGPDGCVSTKDKGTIAFMTADKRMLFFADAPAGLNSYHDTTGLLPLVHASSAALTDAEKGLIGQAVLALAEAGKTSLAAQLAAFSGSRE